MEPASLVEKKQPRSNSSEKSPKGIKIERHFTFPDEDPFDSVEWGKRDARAGDFFQADVEAPTSWSDSAVGIVAKLYFATIDGKRESSVKTLITRVVNEISLEGARHGYFTDNLDEAYFDSDIEYEGLKRFKDELTYILLNQFAAFNSPVWFNLGVPGRKQTCSACFILNVEDKMLGPESITDWWATEAAIFKAGSGSGINLSNIRGSMEPLSIGGIASGPVAYMRPADAGAGTMKSGGAHRRAAKMVQLDVDHPDILDFIDSKVREDERMKILSENGINLDPSTKEGERNIAECTSTQNANISVRLSDKFMNAVENDGAFALTSRTTGKIVGHTIRAKILLKKIAEAAWKCADPGVMFDDTINSWHTTPSLGRISATNPCGELMTNDNSSCNLASLNLVKFINDDNSFAFEDFYQVIDIMITAMDITCSFSELPTKKLEENTRNLRQLGLGYSNLGSALMIQGMPYDSDEARDWTASVTSLMTGRAYKRSAEMAESLGPFLHWEDNEDVMAEVVDKHYYVIPEDLPSIIWDQAADQYNYCITNKVYGPFRNSQVTVIAPTGSISFMMDCDTTGCEPAYSLVTYKSLAGGGNMTLVNKSVKRSLEVQGFIKSEIDKIEEKGLSHPIFSTPHFQTAAGDNPISPDGHLKMVAAIQPHISGAISKTVNISNNTTVQDIYDIYMKAWRMGLKCVSVYRDGSKATQVLSTKKDSLDENPPMGKTSDFVAQQSEDEAFKELEQRLDNNSINHDNEGYRKKIPNERKSLTHKFVIADHEGYITAGMYEDGSLGEIFLSGIGKEGSTLRGMMDSWAISISLGLQYGVPLEVFANKFTHMRFEPEGLTNNPEIRVAKSMVDYIMRWLVSKFGDQEMCEEFGVMNDQSKNRLTKQTALDVHKSNITKYRKSFPSVQRGLINTIADKAIGYEYLDKTPWKMNMNNGYVTNSDKICTCGSIMIRSGTCFSCPGCGATTGCG